MTAVKDINGDPDYESPDYESPDCESPVARGLHILLMIVMALMVIATALLFIFGLILISENSISADLSRKLYETDAIDFIPHNVALACFGGALIASIWLFVLNILRKITGTLLKGDPFIPQNISRLRMIWIVIALAEIIRIIIVNISSSETMVLDIRLGTWFLVFVIAALAEVFRHGAELRRDQALTI